MTTPTPQTWAGDDRREVIQRPEDAKITVLVPGVKLCPLAGCTPEPQPVHGSLDPGAQGFVSALHPAVQRGLVLVEGEAAVEVEDRRYRLKPLDAMTVSPRVPRRVVNLSSNRPAVFHVALASATPDQTWVNGRFTVADQPAGATGHPGAERLCRNDPAARFELAPLARFQDFYNADLGTQGICGGYGSIRTRRAPPCHRHEFDESITIVQGTATCIVEGRRHELSDNATALVPQGRCHYFINLTLEPMAMIWVYAGDRPDRIVMDETFCHPERVKGRP